MSEIQDRIHNLNVEKILKEAVHDDLLNNRIEIAIDKPCPLCIKRNNGHVGTMRRRTGPYGTFLSCNQYPRCKFSWNTPLDEKTNPEDEE